MTGLPAIDSVLLDLDGTLVDSLPGIEFSVHRALELCGAPMVTPDFRALVGPPIRNILGTVSGRCEPDNLDALEKAFRTVYDGGAWQKATLYPEVRETLEALAESGVRLFVVTNKPRIPAERILAHLEIFPMLAAVYSPDRRQPMFKNKAESAAQLQLDYALDPSRTLLVGDSADDAHAAAVSGFHFAGVSFGYGAACSQQEHPVLLRLSRFGELISALSGNVSANQHVTTQPIL